MAEGWARHLIGDLVEPYSAGVRPEKIDNRAIFVMKEAGVDISNQYSKSIDEISDIDFDIVVTVCDHAKEICPTFPAKIKNIHKSFPDPPLLASKSKDNEAALYHYRVVRDLIKSFILDLKDEINKIFQNEKEKL